MIGKEIRLERIINRDSGKTVIVPMDHGVTVGPIKGLINMAETVNKIAEGGANAVVLHKGIVTSGHRGKGKDIGLIIHRSASTTLAPDPNNKISICTVEEAIKLGADAVSVHVNIGANSIIGAGSVVTRDIPPYSLAVGNPALVIRSLKK